MDFTEQDKLAEFRDAAKRWADANLEADWVDQEHRTGTHHNPVLHRRLAADGLLAAGWPEQYGGSDVDPALAEAVFQEIAGFGLRMDGWITTWMVARTILQVGSEELKQEVVPAALRGEVIIVLGYTEPSCGSDVAAAKTRAARVQGDSGGWVINGSKMFTSTAHEASHVFLLTRTSPDKPKHRGLTLFLVPMAADGVQCQPIHTLGGQRTNATYYGDVRVPDSARVGEVDGGWGVMRVALVYERQGSTARSGPTLAEQFAAWAQQPGPDSGALYDSPATREALARIAIDDEVSRLLNMRMSWITEQGGLPGVEGAMAKLFSTEAAQRHHAALLDLLGADGVLTGSGAPLSGLVEHEFRNSVVSTIYGGASEILREIVAERRLELPRSRPVN
jgi:alkylation response protein AidB-like acyl-CoA dehydrogenase